MQDADKRVIVSTSSLIRVSLIDTGDTICIEFEQPDEQAAFVLVPTRCGVELIEGLQSTLRGEKSEP